MSDQHTQAYHDALVDAQAELQEIQSHFDQLARRKTYLTQVVDAMAPLLGHVTLAPAQQQSAPAQPSQQVFTPPVPQPAPVAKQESSSLPARTAEPLIGHEPAKQDDIFANFANTQEPAPVEQPVMQSSPEQASKPGQETVLKQNETANPEQQPAPGDLDQRIKYALNFALLS
jgi:hypothetical protein